MLKNTILFMATAMISQVVYSEEVKLHPYSGASIEYINNSIEGLSDRELPIVSMPNLCWDEKGLHYSEGAPVSRAGVSYQCKYLESIDEVPYFYWESV